MLFQRHHKMNSPAPAQPVVGASMVDLKQGQDLNQIYPMAQGFSIQTNANGVVAQKLTLNSPGQTLLGVAITSSAALTGIFFTLSVNNYNIVLNADSNLYNPTQIHSVQFFQAIQKLVGQDNIQASLNNTTGTTPIVNVTLLYVPQASN